MKDETVSEAEEISEVEDEAVAILIADEADFVLGADHDHLRQRGIATMVILEARLVAATGIFRKVVEAVPVTTDTGTLGAARILPPILHGLSSRSPSPQRSRRSTHHPANPGDRDAPRSRTRESDKRTHPKTISVSVPGPCFPPGRQEWGAAALEASVRIAISL